MTNVEALKSLYIALGGEASDVADANTSVEVLNAIAAKYEGADDATLNPEGILNVAAIVDKIGTTPTGTKSITANGTHDVAAYANAEVNVPAPAQVFRNFTLTQTQDGDGDVAFLPVYLNGELTYVNLCPFTDVDTGEHTKPTNLACQLPVINNQCKVAFYHFSEAVSLNNSSTGCSLSVGELETSGQWKDCYKFELSITDNNANVVLDIMSV